MVMSIFSRLFGRRSEFTEAPGALLDQAILAVINEYKPSAPTLGGSAVSQMRVPDAHSVDIWYSVETNEDLKSAKEYGLAKRLDEKTRDLLARRAA